MQKTSLFFFFFLYILYYSHYYYIYIYTFFLSLFLLVVLLCICFFSLKGSDVLGVEELANVSGCLPARGTCWAW